MGSGCTTTQDHKMHNRNGTPAASSLAIEHNNMKHLTTRTHKPDSHSLAVKAAVLLQQDCIPCIAVHNGPEPRAACWQLSLHHPACHMRG